MKAWKRAVGALKDKNSLYLSGLSRRTAHRSAPLEAAVIKATSHDEASVDYKNFQRVYQWARASPLYARPLLRALSARVEKTRSWAVALKGLMLLHGVFCCKVPAIHRLGRLPFDLSGFADAHSSRAWGFNAFVRAYFAYLDRRSAFVSAEISKLPSLLGPSELPLLEDLRRLVAWQSLLDLLLQVKPQTENMIRVGLIFEAMICVVTEVFEVYSRICRGIARSLVRVYASPQGKKGEEEARLALAVLQKAREQGHDLSLFFDLCREMGVLNPSCCPRIEQIPEDDLRDLERIINGLSKTRAVAAIDQRRSHDGDNKNNEETAIVAVSDVKTLKTIVTDKWEVFEEEDVVDDDRSEVKLLDYNGFWEENNVDDKRVLPDLISF